MYSNVISLLVVKSNSLKEHTFSNPVINSLYLPNLLLILILWIHSIDEQWTNYIIIFIIIDLYAIYQHLQAVPFS